MKLIPYFHNRHSEQSRGIPLLNSLVTSRDVSTALDMTGGRTLQANYALHTDRGCDCFGFFDHRVVKNRSCAERLESDHPRQLCRFLTCLIFPITRPICGDISGITYG